MREDAYDFTDPEACRRILKARAKALAREPDRKEQAGAYLQVVEFMVAHERYGIESINIREVCPLRDFTVVPCTPPFVLGIINVRGQIVSVVDLRKFFDLPEKGLTDLNRAIVLHHADMEFAILADLINGVRYVPLSDIQASLPTLTGIRLEYLKGVTTDGMVILDANKILSDKRIVVHESVEA
jgi:purine-binding chemotaxis protein CheW